MYIVKHISRMSLFYCDTERYNMQAMTIHWNAYMQSMFETILVCGSHLSRLPTRVQLPVTLVNYLNSYS